MQQLSEGGMKGAKVECSLFSLQSTHFFLSPTIYIGFSEKSISITTNFSHVKRQWYPGMCVL